MANKGILRRAKRPGRQESGTAQHHPTEAELENALKQTNWGSTFLTEFLNSAHENTIISYCKLRGHFEVFENLTQLFKDLLERVSELNEHNLPLGLFLGRACGSFLGAVRLSSSGQLSESYAQLRLCLENALYAFGIHHEPPLAKAWLERHSSEEKRKTCKRKFQPTAIIKSLTDQDHRLGKAVARDYEKCIDFGAHPNERSVFPNVRVTNHEGHAEMRIALLNTSREFLEAAMLACATTALNAIKIFEIMYPDQWKAVNGREKVHTVEATLAMTAPGVVWKLRNRASK